MTEQNYENFKERYNKEDFKIKSRCHIPGKYKGTRRTHKNCNLDLSLTKEIPWCLSQFANFWFTSYISRTWEI